jgi:hypothetical protein
MAAIVESINKIVVPLIDKLIAILESTNPIILTAGAVLLGLLLLTGLLRWIRKSFKTLIFVVVVLAALAAAAILL